MTPQRGYDAAERNDEVSLAELYRWFTRYLRFVLVAAAFAGVATFVLSRLAAPVFDATATVVVSAQQPDHAALGTTLVTAPPLAVATYRAAVTSEPVLVDALRSLDGGTPSMDAVTALTRALTVRADGAGASSLLSITVRNGAAQRAADLADAVALAAVRWDQARAANALETIIASLEAQIGAIDAELEYAAGTVAGLERARADLQLRLSSARALRAGAVGRLEVLELARPPRAPVAPRPLRNAVIASVLVAILMFAILLVREALDTRVRSTEELAHLTGVPVLAEFPRMVTGRRGVPLEAASYLRTGIGFATSGAHPKVILVTSATEGQGKSTVSIALAESFARQGYATVLVDADLRRPVMGREYGLDPIDVASLRENLESSGPAQTVRIQLSRQVEVDVIPGFDPAPDPTELLASRMPLLLDDLRGHFDVIVIDSAPVLPVADSLTVAPHCTGVVMAVSATVAERRALTNAVDLFSRLGVRLLGTVATNVDRAGRATPGYAGGYGYGYGVAEATTEAHAVRPTNRRTLSPSPKRPPPASAAEAKPSRTWSIDRPSVVTEADLIDDSVPTPRDVVTLGGS
jgi:polysaccharide biosynthesis transport protein